MKKIFLITLFLSSIIGFSQEKKIDEISKNNKKTKTLYNGWYFISEERNEFKRIDRKTGDIYYINPKPIVIPENFKSYEEFEHPHGSKGISVLFDSFGTKQWANATDLATGSQLIFILNDKILLSPLVNSQITGGVCAFWKDEHTESEWSELRKILTK